MMKLQRLLFWGANRQSSVIGPTCWRTRRPRTISANDVRAKRAGGYCSYEQPHHMWEDAHWTGSVDLAAAVAVATGPVECCLADSRLAAD